MTNQNADNAVQTDTMANESLKWARDGAKFINHMNSTIEKIKESSDETAKIHKTIDESAVQTNLLALNAAVEAALQYGLLDLFRIEKMILRELSGQYFLLPESDDHPDESETWNEWDQTDWFLLPNAGAGGR